MLGQKCAAPKTISQWADDLARQVHELLGILKRFDDDFSHLERSYGPSLYTTGAGYTLRPRVLELRGALGLRKELKEN